MSEYFKHIDEFFANLTKKEPEKASTPEKPTVELLSKNGTSN